MIFYPPFFNVSYQLSLLYFVLSSQNHNNQKCCNNCQSKNSKYNKFKVIIFCCQNNSEFLFFQSKWLFYYHLILVISLTICKINFCFETSYSVLREQNLIINELFGRDCYLHIYFVG